MENYNRLVSSRVSMAVVEWEKKNKFSPIKESETLCRRPSEWLQRLFFFFSSDLEKKRTLVFCFNASSLHCPCPRTQRRGGLGKKILRSWYSPINRSIHHTSRKLISVITSTTLHTQIKSWELTTKKRKTVLSGFNLFFLSPRSSSVTLFFFF